MSYTIKRYGQPNIILPNGAINTETSVTLIGKNYASYGQMLDQNSMTLLQNSAGDVPPLNPQYGQLWYDAANRTLKLFNGSSFKSLGSVVSSAVPPANPSVGDLWFNTADDTLNVYNGSSWITVGPAVVKGTGTIATTIVDTVGVIHSVVEIIINSLVVGIVSKDALFVPQTPIAGFETIGPGYNIASSVNTIPQYFQGTATNSLQLDGLPGNAYMSATGSSSRVDFTGGVYADYIYADEYAGNLVTQVNTGTGLTGGPISNVGTISLAPAVTANSGIGGTIGGVIPDGLTITINSNNVISAQASPVGKPVIESFSPTSGSINGGTTVLLTGQFFTGTTTVTVAGIPAAHFSVVSGTSLLVVTGPATSAASGPIVVTSAGGTTASSTFFTYQVVPTITNFRPVSSSIAGGATVFIEGTNFTNVLNVFMAGVQVTSFTAHKPTLISALTAPTATPISGPIKVVTSTGTAFSEEVFAYTTVDNTPTIGNISPTSGSVDGGTVITITGTNLATVFGATVDGIQAKQVKHVSDTEVQITTAPGVVGSGEVIVYSVNGIAMSKQHFTYTQSSDTPTISFITPISGPLGGGTAVTIAGTNLSGITGVTIAGVPAASYVLTSDTQIVAVTGPADASGPGFVQLAASSGTITSSMAFTYYNNADEPIISHFAPAIGPLSGGTQLLIQGQNFQTSIGDAAISTVLVASIAAVQITVSSDTSMSAVTTAVPAATSGIMLISGLFGSATSAQVYTYDAIPVITSFSPNTGPVSGNTPILLVGEDFIGTSSATVVGTSVTGANVNVVSDTIVELVAPVHSAGSGVITVTNQAGTGASTQTYTYATSPNGTVTSIGVGVGLSSSTSPNPITTTGTLFLSKAVQQTNGAGGTLGGIIPDGQTLLINSSGVVSVAATGNVQTSSLGVGTPASGVVGEIRATNVITAGYSSDERLKENFEIISDPLEKAKLIRGYFFDWKEDYLKSQGGEDGKFVFKHNVGVKAQEVQKALPEVVTHKDDGYLAVKYELLVPLLFECINALIEKIDSK